MNYINKYLIDVKEEFSLKKMLGIMMLLILVIGITGCTNSSIDSMVDPELVNIKYDRLLVFSPFEDFKLRKNVEDNIAEHLETEVFKSYELFPPTREYSQNDMQKKLKELGISGLLTIVVTGADYNSSYYTTSKQGNTTVYGNSLYYTETGGQTYKYDKPIVSLEAKILDINYGIFSWISSVESSGGAVFDLMDMVSVSGETINKQLKEDGKI